MRFVVSNSQVFYDNLHNRLYTIFEAGTSLQGNVAMVLKERSIAMVFEATTYDFIVTYCYVIKT